MSVVLEGIGGLKIKKGCVVKLFQRINYDIDTLPTMPTIAAQVIELIKSPCSSVEKLAFAVAKDPGCNLPEQSTWGSLSPIWIRLAVNFKKSLPRTGAHFLPDGGKAEKELFLHYE